MKKHEKNVIDVVNDVDTTDELINANELNDSNEKTSKREKRKYIAFIESKIDERKYTQKQLQQMCIDENFDVTKSTIQTTLVDCKNAKYNRLKKLVKKDENGILYFV